MDVRAFYKILRNLTVIKQEDLFCCLQGMSRIGNVGLFLAITGDQSMFNGS